MEQTMTMFYSDSETRFLQQQAYDRELQKQCNICEEATRKRKAAALHKKAVPVRKSAEKHA
jgi:hypothetical protein